MALFFTILYIVLSYLSPADLLPSIAPYRPMVVVAIISVLFAALSALTNQRTFAAPQFLLGFALIGAVFLSRLALGWVGGAIASLQEFTITAVVLYLLYCSIHTMRQLRAVGVALVLLAIYLTAQGAAAVYTGYRYEVLIYEQRGQTAEGESMITPRIRGVGTLSDPNDLSQALVLALPFAVLAWRRGNLIGNLFLVLVPAAFILWGVYLTHSRGAVLGLVAMVGLALKDRVGKVMTGFGAGVALLALMLLDFGGGRAYSAQEGSAAGRLGAWGEGIQMLLSRPLTGVGYGLFTDHHPLTAHNSFVLCFAELGLFGYFVWLGLVVATVLGLNATIQANALNPLRVEHVRWARTVRVALLAFLATCWFLSRTYTLSFFLLIGLGTVLIVMGWQQGDTPVPTSRIFRITALLVFGSILVVYLNIRARSLL